MKTIVPSTLATTLAAPLSTLMLLVGTSAFAQSSPTQPCTSPDSWSRNSPGCIQQQTTVAPNPVPPATGTATMPRPVPPANAVPSNPAPLNPPPANPVPPAVPPDNMPPANPPPVNPVPSNPAPSNPLPSSTVPLPSPPPPAVAPVPGSATR